MLDKNQKATSPPSPGSAATAPPQPRRMNISELLGSRRELRILHDGHEYRLTITSKGKLILTK